MAAAAEVIDFAGARGAEELPESLHEIVAVDVVAHLLPFVAKDPVGLARRGAFHEVGEKAVQLGPRVAGAGQAAAAEDPRWHPEITPVLLHQHVGGDFARAEKRVLRLVDGHALVDADGIRVRRVDLPALFQLHERQPVRRVTIDLVGARENEDRLGAVQPSGFQHVQRAGGVDPEIGVRLARRPVVRGLRGGVDDDFDLAAIARKHVLHRVKIADVDGVMRVVRQCGLQTLTRRRGRSLGAKKTRPHIVVDAGNGESLGMEFLAGFGTDQAG